MSVIAARIFNNRIEVSADSILIKSDLKRTNFKKLIETNGMIVGGCGAAEELSLFFQYAKEHNPNTADVEGIVSFMRRFADWKGNINNNDTVENCYIIVYKNKLFEVDEFFVQEITRYTAIGEGESYALAAMYLGHSTVEAVDCACEFCSAVSQPIISYYREITE